MALLKNLDEDEFEDALEEFLNEEAFSAVSFYSSKKRE